MTERKYLVPGGELVRGTDPADAGRDWCVKVDGEALAGVRFGQPASDTHAKPPSASPTGSPRPGQPSPTHSSVTPSQNATQAPQRPTPRPTQRQLEETLRWAMNNAMRWPLAAVSAEWPETGLGRVTVSFEAGAPWETRAAVLDALGELLNGSDRVALVDYRTMATEEEREIRAWRRNGAVRSANGHPVYMGVALTAAQKGDFVTLSAGGGGGQPVAYAVGSEPPVPVATTKPRRVKVGDRFIPKPDGPDAKEEPFLAATVLPDRIIDSRCRCLSLGAEGQLWPDSHWIHDPAQDARGTYAADGSIIAWDVDGTEVRVGSMWESRSRCGLGRVAEIHAAGSFAAFATVCFDDAGIADMRIYVNDLVRLYRQASTSTATLRAVNSDTGGVRTEAEWSFEGHVSFDGKIIIGADGTRITEREAFTRAIAAHSKSPPGRLSESEWLGRLINRLDPELQVKPGESGTRAKLDLSLLPDAVAALRREVEYEFDVWRGVK